MSEQRRYQIILAITFLGLAGLIFFGVVALINPWSHLIDPQNVIPDITDKTSGVETFASYMAVRNLALALTVIVAVVTGNKRTLGFLLLLMGLIQVFDSILGIVHGSPAAGIFPPLIIGAALLFSARYLIRHTSKNKQDL